MNFRRSIALVVGIAAVALAVAAPAFGQTPAQNTYSGVGASQLTTGMSPGSNGPGSGPNSGTGAATAAASGTPVSTASSSSLPFTGLDVGGLVLVAAVLGGTGFALRRWNKSSAN